MQIDPEAFIHELAFVTGSVSIGRGSGVWPFCVLRADLSEITIGGFCNIQDQTVIHCDPGFPVVLGDYVTVGHSCVIHGCTIGNNTLIGMHSTILNGAVIGNNCLIAAHSLVRPNMVIADNSFVAGVPAEIKDKPVNPKQNQMICRSYYVLGQLYKQNRQHQLPQIFPEAMAEFLPED